MTGPRDQPTGMPYPVNPWTGLALTEVQLARITRVREAGELLDLVFCEIGGSTQGTPKGSRNLATAATKLDEALMWAIKDVLDA